MISEPLADRTPQREIGACHIIYAEPHPIGIAEVEFREVPVQMLLCAMLIDAFHATFEHAEIAFDSIGVDGIRLAAREHHRIGVAHIFILAVTNRRMASKVTA